MPDIERIRFHEAGHAVVAVHLGFVIRHLFVRPEHQRAGGVDIDELGDEAFDSNVPVENRRQLAREVIAIFSAGYLTEDKQYGDEMKGWSDQDRHDIMNYAIKGVFTDEDIDLLAADRSRENGWNKWQNVDILIEEGEKLAQGILDAKWNRLCVLVNMLRRSSWIPGPRVAAIVGIQPDADA